MTDFAMGSQFLTEREIAEKFGVSRATANKALASLVSEGLLQFRRGVGTFVRCNLIDYDVRSLVSFTEKARSAGKKPSTEVLTFGKLKAKELDASMVVALGVDPNEEVWELDRIRLADGIPVIFEHRYIVHRHCPRLSKSQVEGSLYQAWTGIHGLNVSHADEIIRAVLLTAAEAKHLQTKAKSPALEVVSSGYLDSRLPLWWERTIYRGDRYEFHSRLGPIQSSTPACGKFRNDWIGNDQ